MKGLMGKAYSVFAIGKKGGFCVEKMKEIRDYVLGLNCVRKS